MKPQDILTSITTQTWPDEINSYHRERIHTLYENGDVQKAVQEFEKIINNPLPPKKTLL